MANTYTQIYIHIVFAVQGRKALIANDHREEVCKYTTGIIRNRGQKLIAINTRPDHIHVFIGMKPDVALSDLVRDIKAGSSGFVNDRGWIKGRFSWQRGFGAFSHSHSEIGRVASYIEHQDDHHRTKSFREEYLEMLREFAVSYDDRYIFVEALDEEDPA